MTKVTKEIKIKYIINPYNCWKTPVFQSTQPMTKKCDISLNGQVNIVLNGIICFSVEFCDNTLLVLKIFQFFSFASKKV